MNTRLPDLNDERPVSAEAAAAFRRDGHVLVRGVASPEEVAAYRPVIRDATFRFSWETRPLEERDSYSKSFIQVSGLWAQDEAVKKFVLARRFARIAADLMGVEGVRLYNDQALFKEPGGGPTMMHQDHHYWPIDTDNTVTMWMPLVPVSAEIGSMTFVNGSHRFGYVGDDSGISDASGAALEALVRAKGWTSHTYGAMAAGDTTWHSGWTLHGAPENKTTMMREVMTIIFIDMNARVTEAAEHQKYDLKSWLPGLKAGDPVASPRNPILYRRT